MPRGKWNHVESDGVSQNMLVLVRHQMLVEGPIESLRHSTLCGCSVESGQDPLNLSRSDRTAQNFSEVQRNFLTVSAALLYFYQFVKWNYSGEQRKETLRD